MIEIPHILQRNVRRRYRVVFLILLILAVTLSSGCLKIMQQSGSGANPGSSALVQDTLKKSDSPHPQKNVSPSQLTITKPTSPDLVMSALPELTPDPYPIQHAMQINASAEPLRHMRLAEFKQTYVLRGNSTGLIINATKLEGPLWIYFEVKPLYDCIENPDSCRGETGKSISRPYLTITVRDNQTRAIIAEDGYGREFSSQKENRTIKIYGEGRYHLTLTGDSVDVTLAVATGAIPLLNETQRAAESSQEKSLPPEILRRIRGGA